MSIDTIISEFFGVQIFLFILVIFVLKNSIKFVPQNEAWVVERFW